LLGTNYCLISNGDEFRQLDKLVIPGVGKIGAVINEIDMKDFRKPIIDFAFSGKAILGICLGMQALGLRSTEDLKAETLGLMPFQVEKLDEFLDAHIPHVGWNSVEILNRNSNLLQEIPNGTDFYFSHSFGIKNSEHASSTSTHGRKFIATVEHKRIYGVQFHPERSQRFGKRILMNFVDKC